MYVAGGTFTLSGGKITGNTASLSGGGVYVNDKGWFIMSTGEISNNVAGGETHPGNGGGVYSEGTIQAEGGMISGNSAKDGSGGGIYISKGKFNLIGHRWVIISGNSAKQGGGVYVNDGTFNVSKSPVIKDNKKGEDADNVYLSKPSLLYLFNVFTGEIHITSVAGADPAENAQFGMVIGSSKRGGEHFIADGANLVGSISDGKLIWKRTGPVVTYTVKFDMQGHGTAIPEVKVDSGSKVTRPTDPTEKGWTFGGWFKEAACTNAWDFDKDTVTKDTTLYAKWTPVIYNITVSSDGSGDVSAPPDAAAGITVHLFVQPHEGCEFDKWEAVSRITTQDIVDNHFTMPASDVSIKAHFKIKEYTVTYDGNEASGPVPAPETYSFGKTVKVEAKPDGLKKDGFHFICWNTQKDGKGQDYKADDRFTIRFDMHFFAKWEKDIPVSYDIEIHADEHGTATSNPDKAAKGTIVTLTSTPAKGYVFEKWEAVSGITTQDIVNNRFTMPASDVSIKAHFKHAIFTVTYDGNGAPAGTAPAAQTCSDEGKVTLAPQPEKMVISGFKFIGWNTQPDGKGDNYSAGQTITLTSDLHLYAKWKEEKTESHAIVLLNDGHGTASSNPDKAAAAGTPVTLFSTANPGYEFDDWDVTKGEVTIENNSFIMPASDVEIMTHFKHAEFTVTYRENGAPAGTAPAVQTSSDGGKVTLASQPEKMVRSGYRFVGWNTQADGKGQDYNAGESITIDANLTLYADWAEIPVYSVIVLTEGDGTATPSQSQAAEGTTVRLTAKPNTGYRFNGWTVKHDIVSIEGNAFTMPASDVEITAHFVPIECTVTYMSNGADSGDVPAAESHPFGTRVKVSGNTGELKKNGFNFTGWNTQADGKGIDYPVGSTFTITDNITLYAEWTEIEKYSITIQTFGPGVVTSDPASASEGELVRLHVSADPGYQLTQWYVYPESIKIRDDMTFRMPAKSIYLYCLFEKKAPTPKKSSDQGTSYWATPEPTETPTATPTPTPTPTPDVPTVKPVTQQPTEAGASPMSLAGILAGLGAAAVVAGLMRRR